MTSNPGFKGNGTM